MVVSTPPHGGGSDPIELCEEASHRPGVEDDSEEDASFAAGAGQTVKSAVPTGFTQQRSERGASRAAAEKNALLEIKETAMRQGEPWYLVPGPWFNKWKNYAEYSEYSEYSPPGPMDFSSILENGALKQGLYRGYDLECVPEGPWQHLKQHYSENGVGVEFARIAVSEPKRPSSCVVPIYPLLIHVQRVGMAACDAEVVRIFPWETVQKLKEAACSALRVPASANPKLCELLPRVESDALNDVEHDEEHDDLNETLTEAVIVDGARFVIQTDDDPQELLGESNEPSPKRPKFGSPDSAHRSPRSPGQSEFGNSSPCPGSAISDVGDPSPAMCLAVDRPASPHRSGGLFGRASPVHGSSTPNSASYGHENNVTGASSSSGSSSSVYDWETEPAKDDTVPGKCGLKNLGNTCFMASGLQCLMHTDQIVDFFSRDFERDINEDNVLGCKGQMAREYGSLVQKVYSGKFASFAPRAFKRVLAEFAPTFAGYEQHDSQEFLNSLLDGLHEDLNRCKEKPATEVPEANGRPDDEVASEAWRVHKKRNDSVILDTFGAQFKSTVKCPDCPRVSVTFDPYMVMSIPLPVTEKTVQITMVFHEGRRRAQKVKVKGNRAGAVRKFLGKKFDISVARIVICELYNNKVYNIVGQDNDDEFLPTTDVWMAYEVGTELPEGDKSNSFTSRYNSGGSDSAVTVVKIVQKVRGRRRFKSSTSASYSNGLETLVGSPLILQDKKDVLTVCKVTDHVIGQLNSMLKEEMKEWDKTQNSKHSCVGHGWDDFTENDEPPFKLQIPHRPDVDLTAFGRHWESRLTDHNEQDLELWWNDQFFDKFIDVDSEPQGAAERCNCRSCFIETAIEESQTQVEEEPLCKGRRKDGTIHLEDCVELMTEEETLGEDNTWYCSACKAHKQASKTLGLWSAPEVLIIHLKRFSYTRSSREKVDEQVFFPLTGLDLSSRVLNLNGPAPIYDLYAVSNHIGGYGAGHYTAYAKNGDQWVEFDDAVTTDIDESTVQSPSAYVLFYRRRNVKDSGAEGSVPGLDAEKYDTVVPETGEAGVVANMSARPRENTGSNGRGRVGPCDFGGVADLGLLSSSDEASPTEI